MMTSNGHKKNSQYEALLSRSLTSPHRDIYTRGLYRLCLKFTTSEDEDEGKLEPSTSFWTIFGHDTTIGNADSSSSASVGGGGSALSLPDRNHHDDVVRKMDDSMTGPMAGVLSVLPFLLPTNMHYSSADCNPALMSLTQRHAANAGLTCGWHAYGDRGDTAMRVGRAKLNNHAAGGIGVKLLTLDAVRWELCKGASFAAGNSVFLVEDLIMPERGNGNLPQLTMKATKGPIRNRCIVITSDRCPFVFGRAHEADLCIMDRELSRRHGAVIFVPPSSRNKRGSFVLVDLESTNGSYMRLVGPYGARGIGALNIGDEFIVGRTGFSVNRFDYGISESIGARPTMEDRLVVIQSLLSVLNNSQHSYTKLDCAELAMTSFCGVFDGHGGDECSEFLANHLAPILVQHMLRERETLKAALYEGSNHHLSNGGPNSSSSNTQSTNEDAASETMRRIIKQSYLSADTEFIRPRTAPQSGSTAATVILFGRRLFAANVGDSRVVLCRSGGQCVELTSDHKPSRPDEAARVRAAGGFILHKRVMGELAITRAFGDKSFKMGIKAMLEEDEHDVGRNDSNGSDQQHYQSSMDSSDMIDKTNTRDLTAPLVSAEPEIASTILSHSDEFLLLACDGLFDVFRSADAIAMARQELINHRGEPAEVARILSDQAIRVRRSRDNVSILIIVFRPFWNE